MPSIVLKVASAEHLRVLPGFMTHELLLPRVVVELHSFISTAVTGAVERARNKRVQFVDAVSEVATGCRCRLPSILEAPAHRQRPRPSSSAPGGVRLFEQGLAQNKLLYLVLVNDPLGFGLVSLVQSGDPFAQQSYRLPRR